MTKRRSAAVKRTSSKQDLQRGLQVAHDLLMLMLIEDLDQSSFAGFVKRTPYVLIHITAKSRVHFSEDLVQYFHAEHGDAFSFGSFNPSNVPLKGWVLRYVGASLSNSGSLQEAPEGYYLFCDGAARTYHRGPMSREERNASGVAALLSLPFSLNVAGEIARESRERDISVVIKHFEIALVQAATATSPTIAPNAGAAPWYKVLGVAPDAPDRVVEVARRDGLQKNHSDKVAHMSEAIRRVAEEKTTEINLAYDEYRRLRRQ